MVLETASLAANEAFVSGFVKEQRLANGRPFPLVLNPKNPNPFGSAEVVASALAQNREYIDEQLLQHGALLLQGFPLTTAHHFNSIVEALGRPELPYVGGAAPRTNVIGRVFTSNESPPDQKIPFHHEMAQANYPDFVEKLERHGLLYVRILGEADDPSSAIGRGWQSTFQTKDKEEAEKRATKLGMRLEWLADGNVKTISGPLPAIKLDERRGKKVWFNSMVAAYTGWQDVRNDRRKAVTFGDGSPLPEDAVLGCLDILEDESVAIPWQPGYVLILDNISVQHARKSFMAPRRVLASLSK